MKRILALLLCLAMVMGMGITTLAAEKCEIGTVAEGTFFMPGDEYYLAEEEGRIAGTQCFYDGEAGALDGNIQAGVDYTGIIPTAKDGYDGWKLERREEYVEDRVFFVLRVVSLYFVSANEPEENAVQASSYTCNHKMHWETVKAPTAGGNEEDGILAYKCINCSHAERRITVSGHGVFLKKSAETINNAAAGENVVITTNRWISFNDEVFDAIAARPDVTITLNFKYKGEKYTMTIPGGAQLDSLLSEDGFCGFLNLATVYPMLPVE